MKNTRRSRSRPIRTKMQGVHCTHPGQLAGWLQGEDTYLWFGEAGEAGRCMGFLGGQPLYRLAKAIVRQFEGSP